MSDLMHGVSQKEMYALAKGLEERGLEFILRSLNGGLQIVCDDWDAICHEFSYGGTDGLLEVMGFSHEEDEDSVIGYLTAEEVLRMVDREKMGK